MKKKILPIILLFIALTASAQYEVRGGSGTPLQVGDIPAPMIVYLLDGLQGSRISFTSGTGDTHRWFRYKENPLSSEPVPSQQTGNTSHITDVEDGYGYFVGEITAPSTRYVWIIDYGKYLPTLNSLRVEEDPADKCEVIKLLADISAPSLRYYSSTGYPQEIRRTYHLKYPALEWDENSLTFVPLTIESSLREPVVEVLIGGDNSLPLPLENTIFTISGDLFSEHFGKSQTLLTSVYQSLKIDARAYGVRKPKNEESRTFTFNNKNDDSENTTEDQGGSAPIDFTCEAFSNEPIAAFYVWKINKYNETAGQWESIVNYTDRTLNYTFNEDGRFEITLHVNGQEGTCADTSRYINVTIGKTEIIVPQVFSPGSSPGINDEFKVRYLSLLKFKCTIFNRWGNKLYEWNDPDKGWDGRVNGKLVPTGVYFYIIEYTGSDRKPKVKKGSVNILRGRE